MNKRLKFLKWILFHKNIYFLIVNFVSLIIQNITSALCSVLCVFVRFKLTFNVIELVLLMVQWPRHQHLKTVIITTLLWMCNSILKGLWFVVSDERVGGAGFLICVMNQAHLSEGKKNLSSQFKELSGITTTGIWRFCLKCFYLWINIHQCLSEPDVWKQAPLICRETMGRKFHDKHWKENSVHREMSLRYLLASLLSLTGW